MPACPGAPLGHPRPQVSAGRRGKRRPPPGNVGRERKGDKTLLSATKSARGPGGNGHTGGEAASGAAAAAAELPACTAGRREPARAGPFPRGPGINPAGTSGPSLNPRASAPRCRVGGGGRAASSPLPAAGLREPGRVAAPRRPPRPPRLGGSPAGRCCCCRRSATAALPERPPQPSRRGPFTAAAARTPPPFCLPPAPARPRRAPAAAPPRPAPRTAPATNVRAHWPPRRPRPRNLARWLAAAALLRGRSRR